MEAGVRWRSPATSGQSRLVRTSNSEGTHRAWLRSVFVDLATEAGVADPERFAGQFVLLYDGAGISARMDHNPDTVKASTSVAPTLIDAAHPKYEEAGSRVATCRSTLALHAIVDTSIGSLDIENAQSRSCTLQASDVSARRSVVRSEALPAGDEPHHCGDAAGDIGSRSH